MSTRAEQRAQLLAQAQQLVEKKDFSKEDRSRFESIMTMVETMNDAGDEFRKHRLNATLTELGMPRAEWSEESRAIQREDSENLRMYLAKGEMRTYAGMQIETDSAGGYFVPQTFYKNVTFALKQMDGLWNDDVITLYEDTHGNVLTCPLVDDTEAAAVIVGEGTNGAENEIATIDRLSLGKIPTWRSGKLITSMELAQDAGFPLEDVIIAPAVATRFQRGISSANVATLISSITSGATSASATAVTLDDILSLMESVDPAYLASSKCFFGMNFSTLISLLKLKDSANRYQWKPRTDANGRLLLFEKPVVLMPSLDSIGASNKPVVLGDFSRCIRRVVKNSMTMLRYQNAPGLAEYGLLAYQAFLRTSFGVLASSSSDSPIKFLTQAAS